MFTFQQKTMADHSAPPSYDEVVNSPYQHPPPGVHLIPPGVEHPPPGVPLIPPGVDHPPPPVHLIPPGVEHTPPPVHYPPSTTTYTPPPGAHYQPASATSAVGSLHPGAQYPPSPAQKLQPCVNPSAPPEIEMTTVNPSGTTSLIEERLLSNDTVEVESDGWGDCANEFGPSKISNFPQISIPGVEASILRTPGVFVKVFNKRIGLILP